MDLVYGSVIYDQFVANVIGHMRNVQDTLSFPG